MHITYKKLWKILIDRDMKRQDLQKLANISASSIAKLGKCENVTTEVLIKICQALKVDLSDIMELVEDDSVRE
ncbi:MAG: helix-turn-helix transcriptional regulator [Spirochaetales bacterium]|nr:helix-turn-helix transcriptional regulator [Spirochaetales bacterium]